MLEQSASCVLHLYTLHICCDSGSLSEAEWPACCINSKVAGVKVLSELGIYFQLVSAAAACRSTSLCVPCTICDYSTVTTGTAT